MKWNLDNGVVAADASGVGSPSYIPVIAEIGINHNGDLDIAKSLIRMAAEVGCDAVKFQKRSIEIVYPSEILDAPRESPWGVTQRDQKQGLEFGRREYDEIAEFCKEIGIDWSASAWDIESLAFVEAYDPPFHKVASAMLTHTAFLKAVASAGRPTFMSTGMATLDQLDRAVDVFERSGAPLVLLHTVSTYPTPEEDLNLAVIQTLKKRYGVPVGYSGHEASVSPSIVAAALGAQVIERHITLDRTMYGSDQAASLEKDGLRQLITVLRKMPKLIGTGVKGWAPGEREVAGKLRYWESK